MSIYSRFGISLALSLTTGLIAGLSTPSIASATALPKSAIVAQAQTATFTDVPSNYWASDYIEGLARLNVISGFGDGTFKPDEIVTRAQFAAILRQAFLSSQPATAQPFADVPADYWAADAISAARSAGFLSGYPGNKFGPNDWISRVDTLVSLANGLKLPAANPEESLAEYTDAIFQITPAPPLLPLPRPISSSATLISIGYKGLMPRPLALRLQRLSIKL